MRKYGSSGRAMSEAAPLSSAPPHRASVTGISRRSVVADSPQSIRGSPIASPPLIISSSPLRSIFAPKAETPRSVAKISSEKQMPRSLLSPLESAAQIISLWQRLLLAGGVRAPRSKPGQILISRAQIPMRTMRSKSENGSVLIRHIPAERGRTRLMFPPLRFLSFRAALSKGSSGISQVVGKP